MNVNEFIKWFGSELQSLSHIINDTERFSASRDVANKAIDNLMGLSPIDRTQVLDLLITSHESRIIGNFQIPFDKRNEFDTIEGLLATIEAHLEH